MPALTLDILQQLRTHFSLYDIFVETGTYEGETTFLAHQLFHKIYTIEIKEEYYTAVQKKFLALPGAKGDVEFLLGDSRKKLTEIVPKIMDPAIFFLDGHWSGGDTGKSDVDCPLLEECEVINSLLLPESIVIIDDVRLFGKGPKYGNEICNWEDISVDKVLKIFGDRIEQMYFLDKGDKLVLHLFSKEHRVIPIHRRNLPGNPEVFDHVGFIANMAMWYKPEIFVEYGTSTGLTAKACAPYCGRLITVDVSHNQFVGPKPSNVQLCTCSTRNFKEILPTLESTIDMAFIDADHCADSAFADFEDLFPYITKNGLIFLHDTYPCEGKWTEPRYCGDSWKVPDRIKKKYSDVCEIVTLPIQPGLTMVKKLGKKLDYMFG